MVLVTESVSRLGVVVAAKLVLWIGHPARHLHLQLVLFLLLLLLLPYIIYLPSPVLDYAEIVIEHIFAYMEGRLSIVPGPSFLLPNNKGICIGST